MVLFLIGQNAKCFELRRATSWISVLYVMEICYLEYFLVVLVWSYQEKTVTTTKVSHVLYYFFNVNLFFEVQSC